MIPTFLRLTLLKHFISYRFIHKMNRFRCLVEIGCTARHELSMLYPSRFLSRFPSRSPWRKVGVVRSAEVKFLPCRHDNSNTIFPMAKTLPHPMPGLARPWSAFRNFSTGQVSGQCPTVSSPYIPMYCQSSVKSHTGLRPSPGCQNSTGSQISVHLHVTRVLNIWVT